MAYTVSPISLGAIAGVHNGTGTFSDSKWLVDPASVPLTGPLVFFGKWVTVTTLLFEIADNVVPNWFGVAIPAGIADFTKPHVFFHPTTSQAGYLDYQYPTKSGKWPELFYYMERLGYQLDAAQRNQIIVMPFLTEAAKDTGIFSANWNDIVTSILTQVRAMYVPSDHSPLTIGEVAVSSFSAGIIYSDAFRKHAPGLPPLLGEVWDFDGNVSSYRNLSQSLIATAGCRVIQYDQVASNDTTRFHVPMARWANYVQPPHTVGEVHGLIRDFMFMHGASISEVGSLIEAGSGTTGTATHTATHNVADTGTSTVTQSGTHTGTGSATQTGTSTATATVTVTTTATATASTSASGTGTVPERPATPGAPSLPVAPAPGVAVPPVTPRAPVAPVPAVPFHPAAPATPRAPMAPVVTLSTPVRPASPTAPVMPRMPAILFPRGQSVHPVEPAPQYPSTSQKPVPTIPFGTAARNPCGCCCEQAIAAMVADMAITAQTAIAGITAIAARNRAKRR